MLIQVAHNAVNAKLLTDNKDIKYLLSDLLSYKIAGAEMTPKYQAGVWDGRSTFFNFKKSTFPAGMVQMVVSHLQKLGHQVQIIRAPIPEPKGPEQVSIPGYTRSPEYEYQYECVDKLLKNHQMIARIATGGGKSFVAMLATLKVGRKTLFLTTRKSLMYQMKKHYEEIGLDVGVIGDSVMDVKPFVNVGMVQTIAANLKSRTLEEEVERLRSLEKTKFQKLIDDKEKVLNKQLTMNKISLKEKFEAISKLKQQLNARAKNNSVLLRAATINCNKMRKAKAEMEKILESFEFVVAEEAHESGGNDYFEVMKHCINANYRLALTATPFMKEDEEANMRLMACSGPIGIVVTEKELIDKGILAKPYFMFIDNLKPIGVFPTTNYTSAYDKGIVKNDLRNQQIVQWSEWAKDKSLPVLILVNRKEHGNILSKMLTGKGIKNSFIYGENNEIERKHNLGLLADKSIDVLIGTNILDVGVDVPAIGMVILAAGGKAEVQLRQRIGRGLRRKKVGPNITYVLDFMDKFNNHLAKHSLARQEIIKETPGFVEGIVKDFNDVRVQ